jgi:hypothetical protein
MVYYLYILNSFTDCYKNWYTEFILYEYYCV